MASLSPTSSCLPDRLLDLAVFDRAQRAGGDLAALVLRPRLLERRRPQQAADVVGAEWRRLPLHRFLPSAVLRGIVILASSRARFSNGRGAGVNPVAPARIAYAGQSAELQRRAGEEKLYACPYYGSVKTCWRTAPPCRCRRCRAWSFVVHGSVAAGDRVLRDGEAWSGEDAATFKAGGEGATVWRWELAAAATGGVVAGTGTGHRLRAKSLQRGSTLCPQGRCSSAATASRSRRAAAPICIGIRGRASAA